MQGSYISSLQRFDETKHACGGAKSHLCSKQLQSCMQNRRYHHSAHERPAGAQTSRQHVLQAQKVGCCMTSSSRHHAEQGWALSDTSEAASAALPRSDLGLQIRPANSSATESPWSAGQQAGYMHRQARAGAAGACSWLTRGLLGASRLPLGADLCPLLGRSLLGCRGLHLLHRRRRGLSHSGLHYWGSCCCLSHCLQPGEAEKFTECVTHCQFFRDFQPIFSPNKRPGTALPGS